MPLPKRRIQIESGELRWAGDHVSDIRALHTAEAITLSKGQPFPGIPHQATLIAKEGSSRLYAFYDTASGYTSVGVSV